MCMWLTTGNNQGPLTRDRFRMRVRVRATCVLLPHPFKVTRRALSHHDWLRPQAASTPQSGVSPQTLCTGDLNHLRLVLREFGKSAQDKEIHNLKQMGLLQMSVKQSCTFCVYVRGNVNVYSASCPVNISSLQYVATLGWYARVSVFPEKEIQVKTIILNSCTPGSSFLCHSVKH